MDAYRFLTGYGREILHHCGCVAVSRDSKKTTKDNTTPRVDARVTSVGVDCVCVYTIIVIVLKYFRSINIIR